jgi:hypothetical protein
LVTPPSFFPESVTVELSVAGATDDELLEQPFAANPKTPKARAAALIPMDFFNMWPPKSTRLSCRKRIN